MSTTFNKPLPSRHTVISVVDLYSRNWVISSTSVQWLSSMITPPFPNVFTPSSTVLLLDVSRSVFDPFRRYSRVGGRDLAFPCDDDGPFGYYTTPHVVSEHKSRPSTWTDGTGRLWTEDKVKTEGLEGFKMRNLLSLVP